MSSPARCMMLVAGRQANALLVRTANAQIVGIMDYLDLGVKISQAIHHLAGFIRASIVHKYDFMVAESAPRHGDEHFPYSGFDKCFLVQGQNNKRHGTAEEVSS